ncbi:MAG: hypothetical protein FWF91_07510 [Coriobacteriia bacterium]|nr:hypothetical protein [Coriobacteriia bacterium]
MAAPVTGFPFLVWEDLRVWVVPPDHRLIRETQVQAVRQSGEMLLLKLAGIDDGATAQRLAGRFLLAAVEDCGDVEEGDEETMLGLRVEDRAHGFIGTVVEEREGLAQTLWVLEGPYGEVLIPAVDEFVRGCDETTLFVDLPKGLVELNR